jgi:hypothetical protein
MNPEAPAAFPQRNFVLPHRWIATAVSFLLGPSTAPLRRTKMADLFVDADQLVVELLETSELVNLPLRFA